MHPNARKISFTKGGLKKLQEEQARLIAERPGAVAELKRAREMGDLSENGAYKAAKFRVNDIDRQIRQLQYTIRHAYVVEAPEGIAGINTLVTVRDNVGEKQFHIVGEREADPLSGKISPHSPVGSKLMHKKEGEKAVIETPKGTMTYTIVKIEKA